MGEVKVDSRADVTVQGVVVASIMSAAVAAGSQVGAIPAHTPREMSGRPQRRIYL